MCLIIDGRMAGKESGGSAPTAHCHVCKRHIDTVLDGVQQLDDHIRDVLEGKLALG